MRWPYCLMFLLSVAGFVALSSGALNRRDTNSTTPGINLAITDHSGHDVSSSFQTMLYVEPKVKASGDLNDRQVNNVRPINFCGDREGIFVNSTCNHQDQLLGSLQSYTYHCLSFIEDPRNTRYHRRVITPHSGDCHDDEICVNGMGDNELRRNAPVPVAHCVKSEAYTKLARNSDPQDLGQYTDSNLDLTLSKTDQKTLLKAESIDTEAGSSALGGTKGSTKSNSCSECLDLRTDKLPPQTDFLDAEVKLLTAGAVAGMMWLTILSG